MVELQYASKLQRLRGKKPNIKGMQTESIQSEWGVVSVADLVTRIKVQRTMYPNSKHSIHDYFHFFQVSSLLILLNHGPFEMDDKT